MQEKDIKRLVKKQLKKEFPHWKRLKRREKRELARMVLAEVKSDYSFDSRPLSPMNELTGVPSVPDGIIPLSDMEAFVADSRRSLLDLKGVVSQKHIRSRELKSIDALLDNCVLDRLLAPEGYAPGKRKIFPHNFFRAELLKSLQFPEISYRKFCGEVINNLERKTERAFVHLPLHKKIKISHSRLSQFRSDLKFHQLINLMVYAVHLLTSSSEGDNLFRVLGVDSTELPIIGSTVPLATLEVNGKKVRIYSDLDADCGTRRTKRDKSKYFVGYRAHTLSAINPATGRAYPLFSLIAPGNHHDNLFLPQLLSFARAMGIETQLVTADEAYADAEQNHEIQREYEVNVVTPPVKKVKPPENVEVETGAVFFDEFCETAMVYMGRTANGHEYKCGAESDCPRGEFCPQWREIVFDTGLFGQIPDQVFGVDEALDLRKNVERPYNQLKHRLGLDPLRARSQSGVQCVSIFAHVSSLLLEIVGARRNDKERKKDRQLKFDLAC